MPNRKMLNFNSYQRKANQKPEISSQPLNPFKSSKKDRLTNAVQGSMRRKVCCSHTLLLRIWIGTATVWAVWSFLGTANIDPPRVIISHPLDIHPKETRSMYPRPICMAILYLLMCVRVCLSVYMFTTCMQEPVGFSRGCHTLWN